MKKLLFFTPFLIFISCMSIQKIESNSINPNSSLKIGFASCLNQEKKMPIFNRIKAEGFDLFLMIYNELQNCFHLISHDNLS